MLPVLHYTKLDHRARRRCAAFCLTRRSEYNGYAADLTRTWRTNGDNDFAHSIKDVNDEQLALIMHLPGRATLITISSSISVLRSCCVNTS